MLRDAVFTGFRLPGFRGPWSLPLLYRPRRLLPPVLRLEDPCIFLRAFFIDRRLAQDERKAKARVFHRPPGRARAPESVPKRKQLPRYSALQT